jgi:hypothetical protein
MNSLFENVAIELMSRVGCEQEEAMRKLFYSTIYEDIMADRIDVNGLTLHKVVEQVLEKRR